MKISYKLTNQKLQTHNRFQWEIGKWYKTSGKGDLCGDGWLHAYTDPLLAVLLNPIHVNFQDPILWKAEGRGKKKSDGDLKIGFSKMRIVERMKKPKITKTQWIAFGILCVKEVYRDDDWNKWADGWLCGDDRSKKSARAAWAAGAAEAEAEAEAAAWAAWAAWAAEAEAEAAAWAAEKAAKAARSRPIDLIAIARRAMNYKISKSLKKM